jgi:hypothetical protein
MTDRLTDQEPEPERDNEVVHDEAAEPTDAAEDHLDLGAGAEEPVGDDNIRQGRVGGVMGGPRQQGGEGQGG